MRVVLVVDDDKDLLAVLSEALAMEGWTVLAAPSASSALKTALSISVDVVLTDLVMPNQDGWSLGTLLGGPQPCERLPSCL
jgi:CheY-like chemotaxis protein